MNRKEKIFFDIKKNKGKTLIYEPKWFKLGIESIGFVKYKPDFYCPEENAYYEVIGSRQRYHQNLPKYLMIRTCHPDINFNVVDPQGNPYSNTNRNTKTKKYKKHDIMSLPDVPKDSMRKELFNKIKNDLQKQSLLSLSIEIGIPYPTFWRMIHTNKPSKIQNWEKIESYYKKKDTIIQL